MKHKTVKARKQGTSMILTIPAQFKACENALFEPRLLDDSTIQYSPIMSDADIEHDRKMIEQSFKADQLLTEEDVLESMAGDKMKIKYTPNFADTLEQIRLLLVKFSTLQK